MIVHFPHTAFVVLKGKDVYAFLNSVSTMDSQRLKQGRGTWGACLTPQGKMMFAFLAFEYENAVYLQTTSDRLMDFGGWLSKYSLNMAVDFSIADNIKAYADISAKSSLDQKGRGYMQMQEAILHIIDPRCADMGTLIYTFNGEDIAHTTNTQEYHTHRIQNGVMDLETDYEQAKSFALECLLDKQHGVHFEKGCYIGQEVTARTHFKGKVKKHIVPVQLGDVVLAVGDDIETLDGKTAGKVLSMVATDAGTIAMTILRTDYIDAGCVQTATGTIKTIAPDWYTD